MFFIKWILLSLLFDIHVQPRMYPNHYEGQLLGFTYKRCYFMCIYKEDFFGSSKQLIRLFIPLLAYQTCSFKNNYSQNGFEANLFSKVCKKV